MAAKSSKVILESAGRDHTVRSNEPTRWVYRVTKLVNTLEPRIDSLVKEAEVEQMIQSGIDVTITPRSE
jgi:hypothetical protein